MLAARRPGAVTDAVAPGQGDLGVLLAYAPLHFLLLEPPGATVLVMTSGNLSGEPIVTDDDDALARLDGLADAWLTHDRTIHVPCDDSVTRAVGDGEAPVRRSRGYAPLPIGLPFDAPPSLAVGGDLKNTFCLAEGRLAWMSGHIGDMDDLATQQAFAVAIDHLSMLTGVDPGVAADRHPAYRSRAGRGPLRRRRGGPAPPCARRVDDGRARPVRRSAGDRRRVRRHRVRRRRRGRGVASSWSPTTAGTSGRRTSRTSRCRAGTPACATRAGWRSRTCGPRASTGTPRSPASGTAATPSSRCSTVSSRRGCAASPRRAWAGSSTRSRRSPASATAPGTTPRPRWSWRRWPARGRWRATPASPDSPDADAPDAPDPAPVVAAVVDDVRAGVEPGLVAARFQHAVVGLVVDTVLRLREETGVGTATLSGGVFLNAFLSAACTAALEAEGVEVLTHHVVPASDAGIALGQLAVLAHRDRHTT